MRRSLYSVIRDGYWHELVRIEPSSVSKLQILTEIHSFFTSGEFIRKLGNSIFSIVSRPSVFYGLGTPRTCIIPIWVIFPHQTRSFVLYPEVQSQTLS